jgi:glycosyltransferase involved in cell wall biosynthesis
MKVNKPNIVIVNDAGHINGGATKTALTSAVGLAIRGYRVIYFCAVEPIDQELRNHGVEVVCTGQQEILKDPNRIRAAIQGAWNAKAARVLDRLLKNLPVQETIVHLHSWTKALSSSLMPVVRRRRVRAIITLNDYFSCCPNGTFYNFQTQEACALRPLSLTCLLTNCDSRKVSHKVWRFARQIIQKSLGGIPGDLKEFIAVSDFSYNILRSYLPQGARVYHVPNPIDVGKESATMVASRDEFIMVGRLNLEKGCLPFAEASRQIGCKAVFVGDGEIREQILRLNPAAQITGWQTPREVQRWLSRARCLVFPSQWYEANPLVVLEAAAKGVPAIVSDGCASRDSIVHGASGLLFRKGDVGDLRDKLLMLQDPGLAEYLGRQAYERYWANPCTLENHVDALVSVYGSR